MKDISNIVFDEDLTLQFKIEEQDSSITLELSDGLFASQEILTDQYKEKILNFINASKYWFPIAMKAVDDWGVSFCGKTAREKKLMTVYILFEQDDSNEIFGLLFRPDFDVEHGCGIKIDGKNYNIIDVGFGDVAFC